MYATAKKLFSLNLGSTKKMESAIIVLKPSVFTPAALAYILDTLDDHDIKVTTKGVLPAAEKDKSRVIGSYFGNVLKYAELTEPSDLNLTAEEMAIFKASFKADWSVQLSDKKVLNSKAARQYLGLGADDHSGLDAMWQRATRVRLAKGLHCARFDQGTASDPAHQALLTSDGPIYVLNGFFGALRQRYQNNSTTPVYLVIEWNLDMLSWSEVHTHIIGDADPARAEEASIRGHFYRHWENLGLSERPNREQNCVHFSASAFEAMVERLILCKGAILFTDPLGAKLLASNIPALAIQNWLVNPLVNGTALFDHMKDKATDACVETAGTLLGKYDRLAFIYI